MITFKEIVWEESAIFYSTVVKKYRDFDKTEIITWVDFAKQFTIY